MMKIIIVDDNKENLYLLETLLKASGYEVVSAANGAEAFEKLHAEALDMIISDILMPVMDGFQLCRECKSDEKLKHIPFVFYTATYTDEKDEKLALKLGADKFIRKPVEPDEFIDVIRVVVRRAEEGRLVAKKPVVTEEREVFKLYSQRLVKKLEKKMLDLEREVTERKQAEEAVRESETRFRTLFEAIPDTVLVHDDEGTILHINEIGAQQLEWSAKDLVGRNLREIVAPENRALIADHIRETHKVGWCRFETTYVSQSGWQIMVEVNERPIKFGEEKDILCVTRDITERKKAEKALIREKNFSDAVINSSPGLLFVIGDKGNTIQWNRNVEIVTGYSAKEISKMNILDFVAKEDKKTAAEAVQEVLTKDQASLEINLLSKPGKKIPFYITGRSTKIENAICLICTGMDITERKQAEEEVKRGHEQLHETLISTVNALASTVEMKDQYTAGHQPRATQLARAIAKEMDLSEEQIEGIRMAASIHDIGKIMVPAEILNKPGPLTEIQYEMIKMHPRAGYDVLKGIKFPWPVAQIVLQHHERMDGSGYPQGVSGEDILLEARILAVADVVEAMASHRPYRPAFDMKVALAEISKNRGVLYDPTVVDACVKLFAEKAFVFL
jgi:PAS domain S-box-containing protein